MDNNHLDNNETPKNDNEQDSQHKQKDQKNNIDLNEHNNQKAIKSEGNKTEESQPKNTKNKTASKADSKKHDNKKKSLSVFTIPILVFASALLLRIILVLISDPYGFELLKTWTARAYMANAPGVDFSHILLYYRIDSSAPFYTYISYVLAFLINISGAVFRALHLKEESTVYFFYLLYKTPMIISHLGIGLLIFLFVKDELKDINKASIASALFLFLPPVVMISMKNADPITVSIFLILAGLYIFQKDKVWSSIVSGALFAAALLTWLEPALAVIIVLWMIIKTIKSNKYTSGVTAIGVFILAFFLISTPFHRFSFTPPPVPGPESNLPQNITKRMSQPIPNNLTKFYPFAMIYHNHHRYAENTTNGMFNIWALYGFNQKDNDILVFGIQKYMAGFILWGIGMLALAVFWILRRKSAFFDDCLFFTAAFLMLLFLHTRVYDYMAILVLPLLVMIFFTDFRARLLFYGAALSAWTNLYIIKYFDFSLDAYTTIPGFIRLIVLINFLLAAGAFIYYAISCKEDNPAENGDNLKTLLLSNSTLLTKCQNWLMIPENQQLLILLFVSFIIRAWRLGIPDGINFDEKYYTPIARDYFYGIKDPVHDASHPPMATYLIGIGIGLLGDNVFGWRIISLVFSLLMLIVVYYFAKALFKSHIPAMFAGALLSFDFLHFVHSRLGMLDMYSSFFNLLSYYLFYLYLDRGKEKYLWGLGGSLAMGLACKWTTLFTIAGIGAVFAASKILGWILKEKFTLAENLKSSNIFKTAAILLILPVVFQFIVYLPLLGNFKDVYYKIDSLMSYHKQLIGEDEISSPWWSWLFIINPIQYSRYTIGDPKIDEREGVRVVKLQELDAVEQAAVTGMGNPIVWWLSIPAFFFCLIYGFRSRNLGVVFACMPFVFQYLPWSFASRITYIFYMLDIIPYICLLIAFCLYTIYLKGRTGRIISYGYLTLVVLSFTAFYPLLSAWSLPPEFYMHYKIFEFWKFK